MAESMEATDVTNPALNYGVVVDCGSSGSRVFVYYWPPHNGNPHTLLDIRQMKDRDRAPVVKKIKPGEKVSERDESFSATQFKEGGSRLCSHAELAVSLIDPLAAAD